MRFQGCFVSFLFLILLNPLLAQMPEHKPIRYSFNIAFNSTQSAFFIHQKVSLVKRQQLSDTLTLFRPSGVFLSSQQFSNSISQSTLDYDELIHQKNVFLSHKKNREIRIDSVRLPNGMYILPDTAQNGKIRLVGLSKVKTDSLSFQLFYSIPWTEQKSNNDPHFIRLSDFFPFVLKNNKDSFSWEKPSTCFEASSFYFSFSFPEKMIVISENGSTLNQNRTIDFLSDRVPTIMVGRNIETNIFEVNKQNWCVFSVQKNLEKTKKIKKFIASIVPALDSAFGLTLHPSVIVLSENTPFVFEPQSELLVINPRIKYANQQEEIFLTLVTHYLKIKNQTLSESALGFFSSILWKWYQHNYIRPTPIIVNTNAKTSHFEHAFRLALQHPLGLSEYSRFLYSLDSSVSIESWNHYIESWQTQIDWQLSNKKDFCQDSFYFPKQIPVKLLTKTNDEKMKDTLLLARSPLIRVPNYNKKNSYFINYEKHYSETNYYNNRMGRSAVAIRPFSFKKIDSEKNDLRLFLLPIWNRPAGLCISSLIDWNNQKGRRVMFTLLPAYSINTGETFGLGKVRFDALQDRRDTISVIDCFQHFSLGSIKTTNHFDPSYSKTTNLSYYRNQFLVEWRKGENWLFSLGHYFISNDKQIYTEIGGNYYSSVENDNQHFLSLHSRYDNRNMMEPFVFTGDLMANKGICKIEAKVSKRSYFHGKRFFQASVYGGYIPFVSTTFSHKYDLRLRFSDDLAYQDDLARGLYMDRLNSINNSVFSQQVVHSQSRFYSWSPYGQSWSWMGILGAESSLPIPIPIVAFFSLGVSGQDLPTKTAYAYEGGVYLHLIREKIKLVLPIFASKSYSESANLNVDQYSQKIRFSLTFSWEDLRLLYFR